MKRCTKTESEDESKWTKEDIQRRIRYMLNAYIKATNMNEPPFDVVKCSEYMVNLVADEAVLLLKVKLGLIDDLPKRKGKK